MVYLLPFVNYLAGCKNASARPPSDPDTMTNTVLEATASTSGKNYIQPKDGREKNKEFYFITLLIT